MKRLALALVALSACLEPGVSLYERADTEPPTLLFDMMNPRILGPDAGALYIEGGSTITLPFSEPMDPDSLRPGIVVRDAYQLNEIPLRIEAPPVGTAGIYTVRVSSAEMTFASGTYSIQLRTLLIDAAGNPMVDQLSGFFRVQ
ncbi:MAG: Ig-like domain-containing protein [Myxococcaceae bacterium]|nr:Ig-like domain-containing protein [Myxococcaceae bacterium]